MATNTSANATASPGQSTAARSTVDTFAPELRSQPTSASEAKRDRSPDDRAGLSREQLVDVFRYLYETRRLEEHLVALYRQNQVIGGVYRSLGQEATAVGCTYALRDGDIVQPLIRDLGAMLVHGVTPLAVLRQYMAKATGPSGGRDLNVHFSAPDRGILGPVSMLGAMVPVLAGCLYAARLQEQREVVGLAFMGDGGSSTGAFFEGFNFAAVQKLPMIVVIEANRYAYSTNTARQLPGGDLINRARGFGTYVASIDGNDVLACYQATAEARTRALAGEGASIIVADSYRRKGHAEHDAQGYVPVEEIADWEANNDPMDRYLAFLRDGEHAGPEDLDEIRAEIDAALNTARDQATSDGLPDASTVEQSVFADGTNPFPAVDTWWRGGPKLRGEG